MQLPPQIARPLRYGAFGMLALLICVFLGASFMPLAATLAISGKLVSARPEVLIQPPYGGPVAEVLVARHDKVRRGDVLLQLDTALEQQQVASVRAQADRLRAENAVIADILQAGQQSDPMVYLDAASANSASENAGGEYVLQMQLAHADSRAKAQSARAMGQQIARLNSKLALTQQQLTGMRARADRQAALLQKGVLKRTEAEALQEQVLMVAAEVEADRGDLAALRDRQDQSERQAKIVLLQLRQRLTATQARNEKQLEEIAKQQAELTDRIARATIRAPMDATVTRLELEAQHSYAVRGKTLLALAQPLAQPHLELMVPTTFVDQLQTGMVGRLVLPSLPQRSMPQIDAHIEAISPRAELDEAGQPAGYAARARLTPEAAVRLTAALSDLRLSEDMPVQLIVEVRETTLAEYLWGPFAAAFQRALQD